MKNRKIDFVLLLKLRIPLMLLLGIILYYLVLGKTWDRYRSYSSLRNTVALEAVSINSAYTNRRAGEVDALYQRMGIDTLRWKNILWNCASELSGTHSSPLSSFPPVRQFSVEGEQLLMQTVAFKGDYKDLLPLLKSLSRQPHIGLPHSLSLEKKARDRAVVLIIHMTGKSNN